MVGWLSVCSLLTACAGAARPAPTTISIATSLSTAPPTLAQPTIAQTATAVATAWPSATHLALTETPVQDVPQQETPQPAASTATPTSTPTYPAEHYILNITGRKQAFSLGCEASVAVIWAKYFGVWIDELTFQYSLPLSDNPDKGFVGDVNGPWGQTPPYAYGVHAAPVAALLRHYGLPAQDRKQMTVAQVKAELAADQPVIAWVIGNVVGGVPVTYTDQVGDTVIVAAYEHVILLTGYNPEKLRYISNGKFYETPTAVFENSWGVLGNMAIIYAAPDP